MKLTGTLDDPKAALTKRLMAAAATEVIDTAAGVVEKAGEGAGGAVKAATDLLNSILKP